MPLSWTVETSRAQPATFEAYQGETLTFEASLQSHGKPLEAPLNYSFFWQTNGMGSTYWEAPCKSGEAESFPLQNQSTNVLFATWSPSMDVGAKVYNCFIGSPSNIYHAAFQLRLRPSPGATPNALPLPTPVIDFAKVRVLNPPWPTVETDPTVPAWAKQANPPAAPVQSVNSKTGAVTLNADDIPYDGDHSLDTVGAALDEHMGQLDSLWPAVAEAQSTADAALPSSHPDASVYGAWDYDSYSGNYGLSIYGSDDSRVWLTPHDVVCESGGPYSTRISLVGLSDEVSYVYSDYYTLSSELWSHIYNYSGSNPHGVTAYDVGAPTVDEVERMIGNITPESIGAATQSDIDDSISATKPNFRTQVLAVGMNIDPTAADEINRILDRGSFESNCTVVVKTVLLNNAEVNRMIVESAKLYWDPGLRVTWQIDVTNGCFYSHIVSDDNLVDHIR